MALGKRSGVAASEAAQATTDGDSDNVIGPATGPEPKKFGQHLGAEAHAGTVPHAGERLQGNVGDHPHYADQPDSA